MNTEKTRFLSLMELGKTEILINIDNICTIYSHHSGGTAITFAAMNEDGPGIVVVDEDLEIIKDLLS